MRGLQPLLDQQTSGNVDHQDSTGHHNIGALPPPNEAGRLGANSGGLWEQDGSLEESESDEETQLEQSPEEEERPRES